MFHNNFKSRGYALSLQIHSNTCRFVDVSQTRDPRDPIDRTPSGLSGANGVGNGPASLRRVPSADSNRNGNSTLSAGNSAAASGGSSTAAAAGGSVLPWTGPEHAVTSDDPVDASAPASEKLGRLQFNISYDFEVSRELSPCPSVESGARCETLRVIYEDSRGSGRRHSGPVGH
jgi:hypothetical protein